MNQPKLSPSTDADWRAYYERVCREQRKEIAALRDVAQMALEVFQGKRYRAGVGEAIMTALDVCKPVEEDGVVRLRSNCHPEANGRKPKSGEVAWTLKAKLDSGETLELEVGKKGRDILFGMMIADCHDSGEQEPA